jgi:hypothetical protein
MLDRPRAWELAWELDLDMHERGVEDAERGLADVEAAGARTTIARAIVRVLALQMVAEVRAPLN